nr:MAG TPA: hypothetical protein [Caudoviricetes sp.]
MRSFFIARIFCTRIPSLFYTRTHVFLFAIAREEKSPQHKETPQ